MSNQLFNRKIDLMIDDGQGQGLDLSEFSISFRVEKNALAEPNQAMIKIYNLTGDTASRLIKEFKIVTLQAGYESNYGVVFKGNITRATFGKSSPTETVLTLECGDGERGYNFAMINKTLSAGADAKARGAEIASAMGLEVGEADDTNTFKSSRGTVFFGLAKNYMRAESKTSNVDISSQDNVLQFIDKNGTTKTEAVLLSSETGLIDMPTRGEETISLTCLLNPILKVGGRIKIDEKGAGLDQFNGTYKILKIAFTGETHGNEWYANVIARDTTDLRIKKKPPVAKQ